MMRKGQPGGTSARKASGGSAALGLSAGHWRMLCTLMAVVVVAGLNLLHPHRTTEQIVSQSKNQQAKFVVFDGSPVCEALEELEELRAKIAGQVLCPGDEGFLQAIRIFNARYQQQPAIVLQPMTAIDVSHGLELARKHRLRVTVKGGGHNPAGLAVHDGALLMDMSLMNSLQVDLENMQVTVGGGTKWASVYKAIENTSVAIVGGGCPSVGAVGLALAGGIGWLSRVHGLVSDNLLSAKVVLANSTVVDVSSHEHPELLWGLRGAGGSNFGVVTSATLRLHTAQPRYFAGTWEVNLDSEEQLMKYLFIYRDFHQNLTDDRLTVDLIINRAVRQGYMVAPRITAQWIMIFNGPFEEAKPVALPLLLSLAASLTLKQICLGTPVICKNAPNRISLMTKRRAELLSFAPYLKNHTFTTFASMFGSNPEMDYEVAWKSAFIDQLTYRAAQHLAKSIFSYRSDVQPAGIYQMLQIEGLGGALRHEPPGGSAWPHRQREILISVQGLMAYSTKPTNFGGADSVDTESTKQEARLQTWHFLRRWASFTYEGLAGLRLGAYGGYADPELTGWAEKYYSADNYNKLLALKSAVGADPMFVTPQRIGWIDPDTNGKLAEAANKSRKFLPDVEAAETTPQETHHKLYWRPQQRVAAQRSLPKAQVCPTGVANAEAEALFHSRCIECCPAWAVDLAATLYNGRRPEGHDEPTLKGSRVLVVGATSGLGSATARMLAALGASVVMAQRGVAGACQAAVARAVEDLGAADTLFQCVHMDLSNFSSIQPALEQIKEAGGPLDAIVLSAATWGSFRPSAGAGGASTVLAVNFLSHLVLMDELIAARLLRGFEFKRHSPGLARRPTAKTRIVVVSSLAAWHASSQDVLDLMSNNCNVLKKSLCWSTIRGWEGGLMPDKETDPAIKAYAASKALNLVMVRDLNDQFGQHASFFAAVPASAMRTNLTETITRKGAAAFQLDDLGPPEENAVSIVSIVHRTAFQAEPGHIYVGCRDITPSTGKRWPMHGIPLPPVLEEDGKSEGGVPSRISNPPCSVWQAAGSWLKSHREETIPTARHPGQVESALAEIKGIAAGCRDGLGQLAGGHVRSISANANRADASLASGW